jgi:glycerate 2-kinase
MKIIIAPDSLEGSLNVPEVEQAIKRGFSKTDASLESVIVPMAEGGEGTVQSKIDATNGKIITINVNHPLFRIIKSFFRIPGAGITAVIEMGLPLVFLSCLNKSEILLELQLLKFSSS